MSNREQALAIASEFDELGYLTDYRKNLETHYKDFDWDSEDGQEQLSEMKELLAEAKRTNGWTKTDHN